MRKLIALPALVAAIAIGYSPVNAQDLVGLNEITVAPGSDVVMTVPFVTDGVEFTVDSVNTNTVNPAGGTSATDFSGTYYVRALDGDAAGLFSTIVTDDSTTLTLEGSELVDAGLDAGDTIAVFEHLTVNDVFPPEFAGVVAESGDSIFLINNTGDQNPPDVNPSVFFAGSSGWFGGPTNAGGDTILPPGSAFRFRHVGSATLSLLVVGDVQQNPIAYTLPDDGDLVIGSNLPFSIELGQTGLGAASGQALFFIANDQNVINPPDVNPSVFFSGSDWFGGPNSLGGGEVIDPVDAFRLRNPAGAGGTIVTIANQFEN